MATFLVLTYLEDWLPKGAEGPHPTYYPLYYAFKIAAVAVTCWLGRSAWGDLRPLPAWKALGLAIGLGSLVTALWVGLDFRIALVVYACWLGRSAWGDLTPWPGWKTLGLAVGLGMLVTALWVGLDGVYPVFGGVGSRAAFNPNTLPTAPKIGFLAVRLLGLVLVVPLFEELFWRSFVIRWIIDPDDFRRVPVGRVTLTAGAITATLFAVEHPAEWLPALLTGALWAWLLQRTRSVSACFVSHAVANLGLGIYVLATGQWKFW
jgi:CAAX prenyl protease-like protein